MAYMVKGSKESLLDRCDGRALRIIRIDPEGTEPEGTQFEDVSRMQTLLRSEKEAVPDSQQNKDMEARMTKLVDKHPKIFSGTGKIKVDPINIFLNDEKKKPIVQKQRPLRFT